MDVQAVIFDMDGTILDTLTDLMSSLNETLEAFGMEQATREETRMRVGNGVNKLIERSVPEDTDPELLARIQTKFREVYQRRCEETTAPFPGIIRMLDDVADAGIACAVISNKADSAVQKLAEEVFGGRFAIAVGEREGYPLKPAGDAMIAVMTEMGVDPDKVLYVGDSDTDIEFAANAGVAFAGCAWGYRGTDFLLDHGATRILDTPDELLDVILSV